MLTVADIRAVGPKVWNGWKAALLRELYYSALERDVRRARRPRRATRASPRRRRRRARLLPDFSDEDFADHFASRGYPFYWLSLRRRDACPPRPAGARGRGERRAADASRSASTPARAVTEITLYTADHPGLFSRIAGALAVSGANIVDAKIITLSNGMALDTFWVQDQDGTPFDRPDKLAKLAFTFEKVLTGDLKPHIELDSARPPSRAARSVFTVPPRVLIDNNASGTHTVIEVNGRDRPGLLYDVTRELTRLNLQVVERQDLDLRRAGRRRVLRQEPVRP